MSTSAHVHTLESLDLARVAVQRFAEDVQTALAEVDSDALRTVSCLQQDRLLHWQREVRRREERVQQARSELTRKELTSSQTKPSCVEERKALERAKAALERAEQRLLATRRWAPLVEREFHVYRKQVAAIQDFVAREMPRAAERLEAMRVSLLGYAAVGRGPASRSPEVSNVAASDTAKPEEPAG